MSGVVAVPAPWQLKSRAWTFLIPGLSSTSSFPAGFAHPLEAEAQASGGEFIGGLGVVMIVSYSETPVGPYDELVYIPGRWKYKDGGSGYRGTRFYVSTKESTENGRVNWNIPKSVANFSITSSKGVTTIKVSHPGEADPFFHVTVKPVSLLSLIPLPLDTSLFGKYFGLVQPPLPAGERPEDVATTQWASVFPVFKGSARLESITPQLSGKVGDGKGFPAVTPWSIGTYSAEVKGEFGMAEFADSL